MKKRKKTIPEDFGKTLSGLINFLTESKYEEELRNIMAEIAEKNGLVEMLGSGGETGKETCDKVLGFVLSTMNLGLMVGYTFGQWYPFEHPGITKDLNYLSSRIPTLNKEEMKDAFFRRNAFLRKLADIGADPTVATITNHEIEKAAAAIVLCWPKNQEAINDIVEKVKKGISVEALVS